MAEAALLPTNSPAAHTPRAPERRPGVQDTAKAKDILGRTATLEVRMVDDSPEAQSALASGIVPFGLERYTERGGRDLLLKSEVILTGDNLTDAQAGFDNQTQACKTQRRPKTFWAVLQRWKCAWWMTARRLSLLVTTHVVVVVGHLEDATGAVLAQGRGRAAHTRVIAATLTGSVDLALAMASPRAL